MELLKRNVMTHCNVKIVVESAFFNRPDPVLFLLHVKLLLKSAGRRERIKNSRPAHAAEVT